MVITREEGCMGYTEAIDNELFSELSKEDQLKVLRKVSDKVLETVHEDNYENYFVDLMYELIPDSVTFDDDECEQCGTIGNTEVYTI